MQSNYDILKERKDPVYVKYITHSRSKNPTKLQKGHFLLLYISKKNKSIVGYAKIKDVSLKMPAEIKQNYLNRIQMQREEFNEYILDRDSKGLIFLELEEIVELEKPVLVGYPITMAGRYVSIEEKKRLVGNEV